MRRGRLITGAIGCLAFLATPTAAQNAAPAADTLWRSVFPSDLQRLRQCNSAELLIATKTALVALDATTGNKLWEKTDLPSLGWGLYWPCGAKTGLSYRENQIVAFDLVSGERRWDASALPPFQEIRGYITQSDNDLLLLFLRTATSDRSLAGVRLSTGEKLWQRDDLFTQPVAFAAHGGVSDIAEYQTFLSSGDTSLMFYVSADGPIDLDLRSGATLWKGTALAGPRLPDLSDYAGMRVVDSTLIIPRDKGLIALDARTGQPRWQHAEILPRRATRLVAVSAGLLVRAGADYVNILDPATGTPRLPRPLTMRTETYVLAQDRYFFVARDRFGVADLTTGDSTMFEKLRFRDSEWASQIIPRGEDFLVVSRQNLFRVSAQGAVRYGRYIKAPGASFFAQMAGVSSLTTYGTANLVGDYGYYVTNEPDAAGRRGNSLLRVVLDDGTDAGRIWLSEKAPTYWVDAERNQILMLADDKTLVALRFPPVRKP